MELVSVETQVLNGVASLIPIYHLHTVFYRHSLRVTKFLIHYHRIVLSF